ncbi:hypothetical protein LSAT2_011819 [Lamellibrachia satsuma]|nr:hypothetical protein LSAT2_011819 [Lamellibrachia satsuma]
MPPIRESGQRSASASAAVDPHTSSCISRTAATNAACCEWETDIEKRMSATEQRVSAAEQIGRDTRRKLGEIRELLQAALPKVANVAAATASCTQEATVANTNTGTSSANQMQDSQMPDKPLIVTSMQIDEAGDETGERSTQWVRALKGFCETTTFHGLRNVAESTNNSVRRILWITIVLISILAYSYQCQHLLRLYLSWPVRMKITMSRQEKVVFPAVTICNQNAFRLVTAAEKGSYRWLDDMYTEKNISTFNYTKWGVGNQSMHDVYLQHAHRKEDMIAS